jgi:hypothetical protein
MDRKPQALSEAAVQNTIRIEAAKIGLMLWRNNSGAFKDTTGRLVRYGLGNDSLKTSRIMKSADLIGIWHGRFVAIECKAPGWQYRGTEREKAQRAFLEIVRKHGGIACFAVDWINVKEQLDDLSK